ncbi:MAG: hypothetical protein AAFW68_02300 [Pseudomonadota bacterium]
MKPFLKCVEDGLRAIFSINPRRPIVLETHFFASRDQLSRNGAAFAAQRSDCEELAIRVVNATTNTGLSDISALETVDFLLQSGAGYTSE